MAFLILLLNGQWSLIYYYFTLDNMELSENKCVFKVTDKIKQTGRGYHIPPIICERHPDEIKSCLVAHIKEWVTRTKSLRSSNCRQLFFSFIRPHGPVSQTNIARWCILVLTLAGVDTTIFHCYSTRAVST